MQPHYVNPNNHLIKLLSHLIGIANAHWSCHEYPEAIDNAQRALAIRENLVPLNEASVAATLAMLSNIYQDSGNSALALDLSKKALVIFQRTLPSNSPILAELFYNVAIMQISMGLFGDACGSFERSIKVYKKFLPEGHPDLLSTEDEYRQVVKLYQMSTNTTQIPS